MKATEKHESRGIQASGEQQTIVVGVDGSKSSEAALAWAVDFARSHQMTIRLVHAWTQSSYYYGIFPPTSAVDDDEVAAAHALLQGAAQQILIDYPQLRVETTLCQGTAATALVDASAGAVMLVVGSRGLGGFAGLMLGSVSTECVHRAHCPVLVFRTSDPEPIGRDIDGHQLHRV